MKRGNWTKEEEQYLTDNYFSTSRNDLSAYLNRSLNSITAKGSQLKLNKDWTKFRRHEAWTQEEIDYFKTNYDGCDMKEMSKILNRTERALRRQSRILDIKHNSKEKGRGFWWTVEEEQYLTDNYYSADMKEMCKRLSRQKTAIRAKARKLGLERNKEVRSSGYNRPWAKEETEYLKENYEFGDPKGIAQKLNRTRKAITERAKILKLKRDMPTVWKLCRKYEINESFFNEWTDDMAYTLGLICADGCLSGNEGSFSIDLHKNDSYVLANISKAMDSDYPVIFDKRKDRNMSKLAIHSRKMYDSLLALNLIPAKSRILKCPPVPDEFVPKFILGEFDGDGSVYERAKRLKISTASRDFAKGISGLLDRIDIYHILYENQYEHNGEMRDFFNIWILRKKDIHNLCAMMYKDAGLYLTRKKVAFEKMGAFEDDFIIKCKSSWKPVIATHIETGEMIKFESIKQARGSGFRKVHIHSVLKGKHKQYKRYTWQYNKGEITCAK